MYFVSASSFFVNVSCVVLMRTRRRHLLCFFFNDTATTEIYTRSLVGSVRMCIRDRRRPGDVADRFARHRCAFVDLFLDDLDIAAVQLEPVSYTHLRAHETVLDLVCRLLLEKKTNTDPAVHTCSLYIRTSSTYRPPKTDHHKNT